MEKLKQCPSCGCGEYEVHLQKLNFENEDFVRWCEMCESCGAEISQFATPERAIQAWNRRADNG